ncbi:MAG: protein kinase domain-containing protein [Phycisphaerales bacterium]
MSDAHERFRRIGELFAAAQRLPPERARDYLEEQTDDESLRDEVLALVREDALTRGALDRPPLGAADLAAITSAATAPPLPQRIGKYRIIRLIGEGGMGAVYEAEQETPRRKVALKVIRLGSISPSTLHRFEREAHTLARLSHPGIARIYDAGAEATKFGNVPYFAMELIEGEQLLEHAKRHDLDLRARLELLALVADALEHAHQQGVVHRDLKPANILVAQDGTPRILDFGVSRITHSDEVEDSLRTESGALLGTLAYMSPEQASGGGSAADARSDVYSLGVIAYELLSGSLPYRVRRDAVHEATRIIAEHEPTSLGTTDRALKGDVETIVGKSLEKQPDRRYQSAKAFADDVRRHLRSEPILARPPSTSYQFSKFARRNRPLVAGVAGAFAVLIASLGIISILLVRTMRAEALAVAERDEAARQTQIAQAVNDFLIHDLIEAVSPHVTEDRDASLVDLLDAASERISGRLENAPEAEALLRRTIALTYWDLNQSGKALPHAERAVSLAQSLYGEDGEETLLALSALGDIQRQAGMYVEAGETYQRMLERAESSDSIDPSIHVMAIYNLGSLRRAEARLDEAVSLHERAYALAQAELPPGVMARLHATVGLAGARREQGRYEESATLFEDALGSAHASEGLGAPSINRSLSSLALVYSSLRRFEDAERTYLEVIDRQASLMGEDHLDTLLSRTNLGLLYIRMEQHDRAARYLAEVYADASRALGDGHHTTLLAGFQLGRVLTILGRANESRPLLESVAERTLAYFGEMHPRTVVVRSELARASVATNHIEEALDLSERALEDAAEFWPPEHDFFGYLLRTRAEALAAGNRIDEAVEAYTRACENFENADPENPAIREMRDEIARLQASHAGAR